MRFARVTQEPRKADRLAACELSVVAKLSSLTGDMALDTFIKLPKLIGGESVQSGWTVKELITGTKIAILERGGGVDLRAG